MKNSKFIIDKFAKLLEQGLITSKDLSSEILNTVSYTHLTLPTTPYV